jgi:hypothetical protein
MEHVQGRSTVYTGKRVMRGSVEDSAKGVTGVISSWWGRMLAGAQEDISTYIIKGLGSQRGLA